MLPIEDPRWDSYRSGYHETLDIRPFLRKLHSAKALIDDDWDLLWNDLHHQGDIGEASFGVVPYLAHYAEKTEKISWHVFAFPVIVELARSGSQNPEIPKELLPGYEQAFTRLTGVIVERGPECWGELCFEAAMACIAIRFGKPKHAKLYLEAGEKEIPKMINTLYE